VELRAEPLLDEVLDSIAAEHVAPRRSHHGPRLQVDVARKPRRGPVGERQQVEAVAGVVPGDLPKREVHALPAAPAANRLQAEVGRQRGQRLAHEVVRHEHAEGEDEDPPFVGAGEGREHAGEAGAALEEVVPVRERGALVPVAERVSAVHDVQARREVAGPRRTNGQHIISPGSGSADRRPRREDITSIAFAPSSLEMFTPSTRAFTPGTTPRVYWHERRRLLRHRSS